jgi:hypothetical protein
MDKIKELLAAAVFPTIKAIGIIELKEVLYKIKAQQQPAEFVNMLKSINSPFTILLHYAEQTKTKIDDGIVSTIVEAVRQVANESDIQL